MTHNDDFLPIHCMRAPQDDLCTWIRIAHCLELQRRIEEIAMTGYAGKIHHHTCFASKACELDLP